jgi:hypothetical protein
MGPSQGCQRSPEAHGRGLAAGGGAAFESGPHSGLIAARAGSALATTSGGSGM